MFRALVDKDLWRVLTCNQEDGLRHKPGELFQNKRASCQVLIRPGCTTNRARERAWDILRCCRIPCLAQSAWEFQRQPSRGPVKGIWGQGPE